MAVYKASVVLRITGSEPMIHNLNCPDEQCYQDCVAAFQKFRDGIESHYLANPHDKATAKGGKTSHVELGVRVTRDDEFFFSGEGTAFCMTAAGVKCTQKLCADFCGCGPCVKHKVP